MSISKLEAVFSKSLPLDRQLSDAVRAIADILVADRCFLYIRDPQTRYGRAAFCYCRRNKVPDVSGERWKRERSENLEAQDPMFAAALDCQPTIYVEDVETADPQTLNRDFEAREFGHRALIHAHLCENGKLWGILQPCVFDRSRHWTGEDRQIIDLAVRKLTPLVKQYVTKSIPSTRTT